MALPAGARQGPAEAAAGGGVFTLTHGRYAHRHRRLKGSHLRYDGGVQGFDRITMNPDVMGGKPCIRGMRVTVGMIVEALAAGRTNADLLADLPYLEEQDIREACFRCAFGTGT